MIIDLKIKVRRLFYLTKTKKDILKQNPCLIYQARNLAVKKLEVNMYVFGYRRLVGKNKLDLQITTLKK